MDCASWLMFLMWLALTGIFVDHFDQCMALRSRIAGAKKLCEAKKATHVRRECVCVFLVPLQCL